MVTTVSHLEVGMAMRGYEKDFFVKRGRRGGD
jgi:hypothetical protein